MFAIRWFENNYMKLNTDKCRLIVPGYKHEKVWANIGKDLIWESNDVTLLGVTIDRDLKFDKHVLKLSSKGNQKLSALFRMVNFLSFNKGRTLFKAFVESQFKYCPIVSMFHTRHTNVTKKSAKNQKSQYKSSKMQEISIQIIKNAKRNWYKRTNEH